MKNSKLLRGLGIVGLGLCAACCLLPILGIMFGVGLLTAISSYLEWAVGITMAAVIIFFAVYHFRKWQTPSCDIDCASKQDKPPAKS